MNLTLLGRILPFFIVEKMVKNISNEWVTLKRYDKEVKVRICWISEGTAIIYDDKEEKINRLKKQKRLIEEELERVEE